MESESETGNGSAGERLEPTYIQLVFVVKKRINEVLNGGER